MDLGERYETNAGETKGIQKVPSVVLCDCAEAGRKAMTDACQGIKGGTAIKNQPLALAALKAVALHESNNLPELLALSTKSSSPDCSSDRFSQRTGDACANFPRYPPESEEAMILGIGIDIVEIRRIRLVLERQADRFSKRVFTPAEQEYCKAHRDPAPHYAVRFAAKEATFKALGTGWARGVSWVDVEILRPGQSAPVLTLSGEAQRHALRLGIREAHVTLSHSDEAAVAMVILEG